MSTRTAECGSSSTPTTGSAATSCGYAPDLNPVEGIWSLLRRSSQANTAFTDPDHLMRTLRHGLRQIQHRSNLIDGCLAETGLTLWSAGKTGTRARTAR